MPRTIRFRLDENCCKAIADCLRRRGVDVRTSPEVGLMGATNCRSITARDACTRRDVRRRHDASGTVWSTWPAPIDGRNDHGADLAPVGIPALVGIQIAHSDTHSARRRGSNLFRCFAAYPHQSTRIVSV
jgi:hypothetical protein